MADTGKFPEGSDLSDFGKLNAMRKQLADARRNASEPGLRNRYTLLIENIDFLKANPGDERCLTQFAKNTADLERYKAGRV